MSEAVNHPGHYLGHPSGVEAIEVTSRLGFTLGNAVKYLWRADLKNGPEDLAKARWYLCRITLWDLEILHRAVDTDYLNLVRKVREEEGQTALWWVLRVVEDAELLDWLNAYAALKIAVEMLEAMLGEAK